MVFVLIMFFVKNDYFDDVCINNSLCRKQLIMAFVINSYIDDICI